MTSRYDAGGDGPGQPDPDRRFTRPPPGAALMVGGMQALVHSIHETALAIDGLRHRIGEQLHLSPVDVTALIEVYNHPDIRPSELGRTLHMGSAGLTALADRLVRAGYLRRSADPSDRRASRLRLSPAGLHAAGWIFDGVSSALAGHLGPDRDEGDAAGVVLEVSAALHQSLR